MGWEVRNGTEYYYRKSWHQGRCLSEYIGNGPFAAAVAHLDTIERQQEARRRAEWQAIREEQQTIDQALDEAHAAIRSVVSDILRMTGHYQHRGQWRKRRMSDDFEAQAKELTRLVKSCDTPNPPKDDLAKLQEHFRNFPHLSRINGLLATAEGITITALGTNSVTRRERAKAEVKAVQKDLGYDEATPLERLLIEQVGLCWLRLHIAEVAYGLADSQRANLRLAELDYWERRLNASQRRFLRAMESLTRIRKLASKTPEILQINIAQQQVNQVG